VSTELAARPQLELSGPKLRAAFESLVASSEGQGGVESYVEALKLKSELFRASLEDLDLRAFRLMCAHMATVHRRVGPYAQGERFREVKERIESLIQGRGDPESVDARLAAFCAAFPGDREHRWVRDLGAELLHFADPERVPLMARWIWDAGANTGVLREIWHGDDVDGRRLEVPDGCATFLALREELAGYLTQNGVFRDMPWYVDLLAARVYAEYIGERGGMYLRTDFATPEDPMLHARRILGLDGVDDAGRTRLKAPDGVAERVAER